MRRLRREIQQLEADGHHESQAVTRGQDVRVVATLITESISEPSPSHRPMTWVQNYQQQLATRGNANPQVREASLELWRDTPRRLEWTSTPSWMS
jgi:hypothetical protein